MPKNYNHDLFDFMNINQDETKENIENGTIVFMDKVFDELPIPKVFLPLNKLNKDNKIIKFKDLKFYRLDEVLVEIKKNNQELFTNILNLVCKGYEYYEQHVLPTIKHINGFDVLVKRTNGEKLEAIGNEKGLSRERIRQIEKSAIEEVITYSEIYLELKFNDGFFKDMLFYNFDDIFKYSSDKDTIKVIEYALKTNEIYHFGIYSNEFNSFYAPSKKNYINLIKRLISLNDFFNFYDCYSKINNTLIFNHNILDFTFELYKKYLLNNDYSFKGNLAMKPGTCTTNSILSSSIKEFYPKGIVIDEKGINELNKKIENKYDYQFKITSAISKIDELNPELIVWGKQVRIHIDNVHIKEEKRNEIIKTFENVISNTSYSLLDDIFNIEEIKTVLNKTEINDKYKLYGYLKYYLKDKYYFKKMAVRSLNLKDFTLNELVYNYIDNHDYTTIEKIVEDLDISLTSVQSIARDDIRIVYTNNQYTLASKIKILEDDLNKLFLHLENDVFDQSLKFGYTNSGYLHRDNLYTNHIDEWQRMGIKDSQMLYHISRYYFSNKFDFFTPYIQSKSYGYAITFKKIISDYFDVHKGIIDIDKAQKDIGYISNTKDFSLIYSLRSFDFKFFRMGFDRMALLNNVSFDDITKYMLMNRLKEYFKNNEIALEKDLEVLSKGLYYFVNDEKCYMNYHSLASYIDNYVNDYHVLNSLGINNYLTSKYAVTKENMTYLELIYKCVNEHFQEERVNKVDVMKYIKESRLLVSIPNDLFGDLVTYEDEQIVFKK